MKFVKFFTDDEKYLFGKPVLAKRMLPMWYKKAESDYKLPGEDQPRAGVKKCMPFVDSMISGYFLTTPFDITVTHLDDGSIFFEMPETVVGKFIEERPKELGHTIPRPPGFAPNSLAFKGFWGWKTPKGYSSLVTHPLNRGDLPFHVLSGIMDSDEYYSAGNVPFFIKEDFQGVIPAGTPFAQIIPIKRESWTMIDKEPRLREKSKFLGYLVRTKEYSYKRIMWHRKEYK